MRIISVITLTTSASCKRPSFTTALGGRSDKKQTF